MSRALPMSESTNTPQAEADLRVLFHRLNNQLGIILPHGEQIEPKATDDIGRARAAQVVSSVLEAMGTAREIRNRTELATL